MPTPTYTPLATLTLAAGNTTVSFSSISQAYKDLVLVIDGAGVTGQSTAKITFNASETGYDMLEMRGDGATASSSRSPSYTFGVMADNFSHLGKSAIIVDIFNYSSTNIQKTFLSRHSSTYTITELIAGKWSSNTGITQISCVVSGYLITWAAGSTFTLYGIAS